MIWIALSIACWSVPAGLHSWLRYRRLRGTRSLLLIPKGSGVTLKDIAGGKTLPDGCRLVWYNSGLPAPHYVQLEEERDAQT